MLKHALIAIALAALLAAGLTQLFLLRFRAGDVLPPYSTLRADPLGAKGFHDALQEIQGLEVRRNFRAGEKLRPELPASLIYTSAPHSASWGARELEHIESLMNEGLRVVFTFKHVTRARTQYEEERAQRREREQREAREEADKLASSKKERTPHPAPAPEPGAPELKKPDEKSGDQETAEEDAERLTVSFWEVAKRWGFSFAHLPAAEADSSEYYAELQDSHPDLEPRLPWHTGLHFEVESDDWQTLYSVAGKPVVIERPFGKGSIALASDSYLLSNEALSKERAPRYLAWLAGNATLVIFDEESRGIKEQPGIATLVRKYNLHGLVAALLILALLFVWKNASRLVPPYDDSNMEGDLVIGKESSAGFINLLRRSIPPARVLEMCAAEWRKAFDHDGRSPKAAHVEAVLAAERTRPARQRNLVAAYKTIAAELSRK